MRQDGYAMPAAVIFMMVGMLMWSAAYQRLSSVVQIETHSATKLTDAPTAGPALAAALDLLKTGSPPGDGYRCTYAFNREGALVERELTFDWETADVWTVTETAPGFAAPDSCPDSFAP